ncbi:MAG: AmmeMemoRadiSam system protein A, partial [Bacillota bacterium]|nr:AmmeMemoRadiSam system protein A [Bacillota bacterium]
SRRIVIVASGDLSPNLTPSGPYGYCAEGPEFDARAVGAMKSGDFSVFLNFDEEFCEKAAECGLRSFVEMAGALDGKAVRPDFLSYEGPFGVGYAVCGYEITGPDEKRRFGLIYEKEQLSRLKDIKENEDEYVRLARLSLESYIIGKTKIKRPDALPHQMLAKKAGVFVSLKKDGLLRGCIGTIEPVKACVADEIIENAVSAASKDPRFEPVDKSELPFLVYSVDVLGVPEPVTDVKELDAREYGVIVSAGERRGLLLPNLGGIDTPERQIEIALSKAGIGANEKYRLERFNVVRHK